MGRELSKEGTVERALLDAIAARYPKEGEAGPKDGNWAVLNLAYASAMEGVYRAFPDDMDVAALFVDSVMNLNPWKMWDLRTGQPSDGARTLECMDVLERGLEKDPYHPGMIHLYIHLLEMSPFPERALRAADNLRGLCPDAGHLNHMPTHLDILVGDYRRAVASNSQAIVADQKWVKYARETGQGEMGFYTLYRCHNMHFRIYAAMFAGQKATALATATELEKAIPESLLRTKSPPMADWLEGFLTMKLHVLIRFGLWEQIIALPLPQNKELYCSVTAMTHYAKGIAYAIHNGGDISKADEQRALFREAVKRVPESRTVFNNTVQEVLRIASAMLDGEVEYRRGPNPDYDLAFSYLRKAVELDDTLPYDEPWGWMQPARHALGALLLEQNRVEEAAQVYRADLGLDDEGTLARPCQHRNNVWSLHGYFECLGRLPDENDRKRREGERKVIGQMLQLALSTADVKIKSSCFCRTRTSNL